MRHLQERDPVQVTLERGMLRLRRGNPQAEGLYDQDTTNALREYFQAERDDALGRWRDTENPNIVVYPIPAMNDQGDGYGRAVWVLDEAEMVSRTVLDDRHSHSSASRYFAAHPQPQPEPKPWLEAKPGEVWALTYAGIEETAWVADFTWGAPPRFRQFKNLLNPIFTNDKHITAGRRIWPEGEASE